MYTPEAFIGSGAYDPPWTESDPHHVNIAGPSAALLQSPVGQSALRGWGILEIGALLLVAGAAAALVMAIWSAMRTQNGTRSIRSALRSVFGFGDSGASSDQAAAELRALIDEAREMADQLAGAFDARAAELERRLMELESRCQGLSTNLDGNGDLPVTQAGAAERRPASARSLGSAPGHSGRISTAVPLHETDPMTGEIYRLADAGMGPVEIARRLGQHTGKVELILALRRN